MKIAGWTTELLLSLIRECGVCGGKALRQACMSQESMSGPRPSGGNRRARRSAWNGSTKTSSSLHRESNKDWVGGKCEPNLPRELEENRPDGELYSGPVRLKINS